MNATLINLPNSASVAQRLGSGALVSKTNARLQQSCTAVGSLFGGCKQGSFKSAR